MYFYYWEIRTKKFSKGKINLCILILRNKKKGEIRMIKNRTFQLMFQTAFCTLGFLGIIASFGTFNYAWRGDFYVHFTNLSNYLCIGVVLAELIQTVKKKRR